MVVEIGIGVFVLYIAFKIWLWMQPTVKVSYEPTHYNKELHDQLNKELDERFEEYQRNHEKNRWFW